MDKGLSQYPPRIFQGLEHGVQVARDAEETADDYVMLSVGYASAIGTSLWAEIKEDRAKVVWLNSSIMKILIPNPRLIVW
jgi:hypothetical protein